MIPDTYYYNNSSRITQQIASYFKRKHTLVLSFTVVTALGRRLDLDLNISVCITA